MNKDAIKFLAGMAAGIVVSNATMKYLQTEDGKYKKEKAKKIFNDFSGFVSMKIKDVENFNKSKYKKIVSIAAEEFGRAKNLAQQDIDELERQTNKLWDEFSSKMATAP